MIDAVISSPKDRNLIDASTESADPWTARRRTVIGPSSPWVIADLPELWRYRELLLFLVLRDVRVRYKQTLLGTGWAILQPAMMMVVFTYFFHRLGKLGSGDVPYPLFACAGLLAWMFFSQAVLKASVSIVIDESLISKVYFPRLLVPLASVGAVIVDFLIGCTLLAVMMAWYGYAPSFQAPIALLALGGLLLHAAAAGVLLAALNVRFRDFRYLVPFAMQLLMFATPTVYMELPKSQGSAIALLVLNPAASLIQAFRAGILGGDVSWIGLGAGMASGLFALVIACLVFRRFEDSFADVI